MTSTPAAAERWAAGAAPSRWAGAGRSVFLLLGLVGLPLVPRIWGQEALDGDLHRFAVLHAALALCLVTCLPRAFDAAGGLRPGFAVRIVWALLALKAASLGVAADPALVGCDLLRWEGAALLGLVVTLEPGARAILGRLLLGPGVAVAAGIAGYGLGQAWEHRAESGFLAAPVAVFGNANGAGAYAGTMLVLSLWGAWAERAAWLRILRTAGAAAVLAWLVVLGSRGAWVAAACGAVVLVAVAHLRGRCRPGPAVPARGPRLRLVLLAVALAAGIGAGLALGNQREIARRAASTLDPGFASTRVRLLIWQASARIFADHPWLGVGAGNFRRAYPAYRPEGERRLSGPDNRVDTAHNDLVQLAVESGIAGVAAWLALIACVAGLARRAARAPGAGESAPGLLAALATTLVDGLTSNPLLDATAGAGFWAALFAAEAALVAAPAPVSAPVAAPASGTGSGTLRAGVLFGALAVALVGLARVDLPRADADRILARVVVEIKPQLERSAPINLGLGRWSGFERDLRWAESLDPHRFEIPLTLGRLLNLFDGGEEALAAFRRAAAIDPTDAGARNHAGMSLVRRGRMAEAEVEFRAAAHLDAWDGRNALDLGLCLANLGRPGEAEAELRRALDLAPGNAIVEYNLALLAALRADRAECLRRLADAKAHGGDLARAAGEPAFAALAADAEFRRIVDGR